MLETFVISPLPPVCATFSTLAAPCCSWKYNAAFGPNAGEYADGRITRGDRPSDGSTASCEPGSGPSVETGDAAGGAGSAVADTAGDSIGDAGAATAAV